jgi:hypothetical protein
MSPPPLTDDAVNLFLYKSAGNIKKWAKRKFHKQYFKDFGLFLNRSLPNNTSNYIHIYIGVLFMSFLCGSKKNMNKNIVCIQEKRCNKGGDSYAPGGTTAKSQLLSRSRHFLRRFVWESAVWFRRVVSTLFPFYVNSYIVSKKFERSRSEWSVKLTKLLFISLWRLQQTTLTFWHCHTLTLIVFSVRDCWSFSVMKS